MHQLPLRGPAEIKHEVRKAVPLCLDVLAIVTHTKKPVRETHDRSRNVEVPLLWILAGVDLLEERFDDVAGWAPVALKLVGELRHRCKLKID